MLAAIFLISEDPSGGEHFEAFSAFNAASIALREAPARCSVPARLVK